MDEGSRVAEGFGGVDTGSGRINEIVGVIVRYVGVIGKVGIAR